MQDKELYQHILGLKEPWKVLDVELDSDNERIVIDVEHPKGTKWERVPGVRKGTRRGGQALCSVFRCSVASISVAVFRQFADCL